MPLYETVIASRLAEPEGSSTGALPWRAVTAFLFMAALAYAAAAALALPHGPSWAEAASVFSAGAVPGLTVTLLLWLARPHLYPRTIRKRLVCISLAGAAAIALTPLLLVGSWP